MEGIIHNAAAVNTILPTAHFIFPFFTFPFSFFELLLFFFLSDIFLLSSAPCPHTLNCPFLPPIFLQTAAYTFDSNLLQNICDCILQFLFRHLFLIPGSICHIPRPDAGSMAKPAGSCQCLQRAHLGKSPLTTCFILSSSVSMLFPSFLLTG